ncbi:MAG: oligosaccharide flippase family protein, partial [Bacteroidaceae bacterium]|nr:oligosaccharide flippase family protein [Bacteroidaceae bacterium]
MTKGSNAHSLKHTVAKGMLWGGVSNTVCQLLSLFFGIYLARLLGPDDYGPIGMLAIFTAIAGSLQDSGFVVAIANRKTVGHDDYNAVFWFNILISLFMYAVLYACAPLIADFFNQPELVALSRYNFLGFVVAGFSIAPSAYLFRELKVKQKSISLILSITISGITGIVLAMNGYSYWGIATQSIMYVLVRCVVCWYFTPWRPSFKINFAPLKYLFAFSYRLLITNLFQRFNWNIFSFILGKYYPKDVGNYVKAAEWFNMGGE